MPLNPPPLTRFSSTASQAVGTLVQLPDRMEKMARKFHPLRARLQATAEKTEKEASPPGIVVKAVVHALTARRPRTRHLEERDAKIRRTLRILPTPVVDRRIMGPIEKGKL